jgi:pyruvate-ferredoxin/flavodoxin oxidoreductase
LENYIYNETRYTMLAHSRPQEAKRLLELARDDVRQRWRLYEHWATMPVNDVAQEDTHA